MALSTEQELPSGVILRYWRVVGLDIGTNVQNTIEVCGYTSQAKREAERAAIEAGEPFDVFTDTRWHVAPYDQEMTIAGAYEWLKENIDEFKEAQDVLE